MKSETPVSGLVWRVSMRWRTAIDREIGELGLTHAQYAVLAPLLGLDRRGERPTQRELADLTGLEALYVSKLARALETAGVLERASDPADARAVRLSLTAHGRDVTERAVERVVALQDELLAPIGGAGSAAAKELAATLRTLLGAADGA